MTSGRQGAAQSPEKSRGFYANLADDDLVRFNLPGNPTPEQASLAAEICRLDHRSLHSLGLRSMEREEVKRLLYNAANLGFAGDRAILTARTLLTYAETIYWKHIQGRNRIHYLLGALIGGGVVAGLGVILSVSGALGSYLEPELLPPLLLFACMGSFTSLLIRLTKIDLRQETSRRMLYVSGATKPLTATFFALVVFLILDLGVVSIQLGQAGEQSSEGVLLIAAFLCGFSERFAKDLLGSFERGAEAPEEPPPQVGTPTGTSPPASPRSLQ